MPSWSIGYPGKERLEVFLSPEAASECGYEWLAAQVKVDVGGFRGDVSMSILLSDLIRFKEALEPVYRTLCGAAEFTTIEGQLRIMVEIDKAGHVKASGELLDAAGIGNTLRFVIRFDQTFLGHTISEIDKAISEIKGS